MWLQRREQGFAAPGVVADGDVFGDLGLDSPSVLAPSFRLSVHTTPDTTISASQGTGSGTFSWTYGRAEACPMQLTIATRLAARPCVLLDVGAVSAGGNGEVNTSSHIRAWAAVGGLARLDWTLPLQGNTAAVLELQGGVAFPLVREDFQFQPSTPAVPGARGCRAGRPGSGSAFSVMRMRPAGHTYR